MSITHFIDLKPTGGVKLASGRTEGKALISYSIYEAINRTEEQPMTASNFWTPLIDSNHQTLKSRKKID